MSEFAKFDIGDVVIHKRFLYRAVIVDIDPWFQASGRYNPAVLKHAFAQKRPWYRLLVDDSNQMTYVEEIHLEKDEDYKVVDNPQIERYLIFRKGKYCKNIRSH